jgi:creatinine amidohydrolase
MLHGEQKWPEVEAIKDKVIVVPLGSLEQHGHHMPMLTDSMIATEIVARSESQLADEAVFLPVLWVGASDHHLGFPGTISLNNAVYVEVLEDILESLIGAGYRKIFLLNAHGGNITPGRMATLQVQLRHPELVDLVIAFSSWWSLADKEIAAINLLEQKIVTHACELETSMILQLRPELVDMDLAAGSRIPFESAFYTPDFSAFSRVDVPRAFHRLSVTGAFGNPAVATAEKGELLFQIAVEQVVKFVREMASWSEVEPH